jgi:hypothetical protein
MFLSSIGMGQTLLVENFNADDAVKITDIGWTAHSGAASNPISIVLPGLDYSGYFGTGIGNAAGLNNTGEDAHKSFTSQTTGDVFASFLVKVNTSVSGYFAHFGPTTAAGSDFRARVFIDGTGPFKFGLSKGSSTATLATSESQVGTTYLVVLKYKIIEGAVNDEVSLYVFDSGVPSQEPGTPTVGPLTDAGISDINPNSFAIRQFNSSQRIVVDAIRVATSWSDAVKATTPTIIASKTEVSDFLYTVDEGPSAVKSFTVSGYYLTNNVNVSLPVNYELSLSNDPFTAVTEAITLEQTNGTVVETIIYARLKAGLAAETYNERIIISSTNADNQVIDLKGTVASVVNPTLELTGTYTGPYYAGDNVTITWTATNFTNALVDAWVPSENDGAGGWINMAAALASAGTASFTIPADAKFSAAYKLRVRNADAETPLVETATFKVREVHTSIATLRARPANTEARYDGTATVTYSRPATSSGRNQKYIQDDSNAILIDDPSPFVIKQEYPVGSNISGLIGKISIFGGLVQFVPLADPGAPVSLDNPVVPFTKDLTAITSADQAKLIKLSNITFTSFGTTGKFATSTNYNIKDANEATSIFRTAFAEANYIGTDIPTTLFKEMLVLVGEYNGTIQLTSRSTADWSLVSNDASLSTFKLGNQSVLSLEGLKVTNPTDNGATLFVSDFTNFAGIEVVATSNLASFTVQINGTLIPSDDYASKTLANNDVVLVTVTAENESVAYYKVKLSSENRKLTLTAPAGGETFNTNDDVVFTWTSENIEKINLYAIDQTNGKGENLINEEGPIDAASGTYTFKLTNGISGSYIIRIADASDISFFNESSSAVTIVDNVSPTPLVFIPAKGAAEVATSFTLSVQFDEEIKKGTGNLTIHQVSDNTVVVTVTENDITITDDIATASISGLTNGTAYYVNVQAGMILDNSNNPQPAISNATEWTFTTLELMTKSLIFSEYVEGTASNRAIEIYNATGADVDLSTYSIKQSYNGEGWGIRGGVAMTEYVLPLTGTLAAGEVYVIYNADAVDAIKNVGDLALTYGTGCVGCRLAAFTGNDALGLFKNDVLIDVIGVPSEAPAAGWPVAGTGSTIDKTLVRKFSVVIGNTNWTTSAGTNADDSEWIVFPIDKFDYLGSHQLLSSVKPNQTISINAYPNPFTNTIWLDNAENASRVVVINLIGQQVLSVNLNGQSRTSIATDNLPSGVYLVSVFNTKGERTVKKMIKR